MSLGGWRKKNLFVYGPEVKREIVIKPRQHSSLSKHRLYLWITKQVPWAGGRYIHYQSLLRSARREGSMNSARRAKSQSELRHAESTKNTKRTHLVIHKRRRSARKGGCSLNMSRSQDKSKILQLFLPSQLRRRILNLSNIYIQQYIEGQKLKRKGMGLQVQFSGKQILGQRLTLGYAFRTNTAEGQQNRTEGETK